MKLKLNENKQKKALNWAETLFDRDLNRISLLLGVCVGIFVGTHRRLRVCSFHNPLD